MSKIKEWVKTWLNRNPKMEAYDGLMGEFFNGGDKTYMIMADIISAAYDIGFNSAEQIMLTAQHSVLNQGKVKYVFNDKLEFEPSSDFISDAIVDFNINPDKLASFMEFMNAALAIGYAEGFDDAAVVEVKP